MTIRIGIIGASGHFGYVLDGLRQMPDAQLVAVAPGCPEEDIGKLLANPAVVAAQPAVYGDYREMLDRGRLDVVAVNPFYYLHDTISAEALRRGVAPFCEKPLALDLRALEALRQVQQAVGLPVGIMLAFRYEPRFYTAQRLVAAGAIGEATVGYAQKSYKLGTRPVFYKKRETFGGLIPWVGIHAIDWFQFVSGRRYVAVTARHSNLHAPQYPGTEDNAACLFELDNGGSAVMSFDFLRPAGAPSHGDDRLRLIGSQGCLDIREPGVLEVITREGPQAVTPEPPPLGIFADWARSVLDRGHRCLLPTEEAFAITEVALKAREAADRGVRVTL